MQRAPTSFRTNRARSRDMYVTKNSGGATCCDAPPRRTRTAVELLVETHRLASLDVAQGSRPGQRPAILMAEEQPCSGTRCPVALPCASLSLYHSRRSPADPLTRYIRHPRILARSQWRRPPHPSGRKIVAAGGDSAPHLAVVLETPRPPLRQRQDALRPGRKQRRPREFGRLPPAGSQSHGSAHTLPV